MGLMMRNKNETSCIIKVKEYLRDSYLMGSNLYTGEFALI